MTGVQTCALPILKGAEAATLLSKPKGDLQPDMPFYPKGDLKPEGHFHLEGQNELEKFLLKTFPINFHHQCRIEK